MYKDDFKPHMMYNKKTGKGIKATSYARHMELKKKGYTHTKPTGVNMNRKKRKVSKRKTTKKRY